jgi:hypothetical protein
MRAHLDCVEPAESSKRQEKEDGARGPLCERVAFLGVILTGDGRWCGSSLFAGHFRGELESQAARGCLNQSAISRPARGQSYDLKRRVPSRRTN